MLRVNTGRQRICGGAEMVTSGEVSERIKETVSKYVEERNRKKRQEKTKRLVILKN
jgi:hypothetical protein